MCRRPRFDACPTSAVVTSRTPCSWLLRRRTPDTHGTDTDTRAIRYDDSKHMLINAIPTRESD